MESLITQDIQQNDLKIINNTYMLKTEYFNQYLDNNKIENIIFNKILKIGLGKKQKIELLSYYYENGNTVYIHKYKPFKSMELLYIELNKINKQLYVNKLPTKKELIQTISLISLFENNKDNQILFSNDLLTNKVAYNLNKLNELISGL